MQPRALLAASDYAYEGLWQARRASRLPPPLSELICPMLMMHSLCVRACAVLVEILGVNLNPDLLHFMAICRGPGASAGHFAVYELFAVAYFACQMGLCGPNSPCVAHCRPAVVSVSLCCGSLWF